MISREKVFYTRIISAVLLIILTAVLVVYMDRMLEMSIVTSNESLPYVYSDKALAKLPIPQDDGADIILALDKIDKKYDIGKEFLDFCTEDENIDPNGSFLSDMKRRLESAGYSDDIWADLTGYTYSVLYDMYTGRAYDEGEVTLLGDIYDQRKTTVFISFDGADAVSDAVAADRDKAGVTVCADDEIGTRYYISGGLKLSLCIGDDSEAVKNAKSQSDVTLAVVFDADSADEAVGAGADVVVVMSEEKTAIEYCDGAPIVCGLPKLGCDGGAYLTLSTSVGISPVLRYYPCGEVDGAADILTDEAMSAAIESVNGRSQSAVVGDDNKIKEK